VTAHRAYVGVGANLGDRAGTVKRALRSLSDVGTVVAQSSIYRTKPWGRVDQPWFANAVALIETTLSAVELLDALKELEKRLGRSPTEHWGPRTIDLDLLIYDDLEIDEPGLRVPHPHLTERAFVLVPLAEIEPRFAAMREALAPNDLAGVVYYDDARSAGSPRESVPAMSEGRFQAAEARVHALARFLAEGDAVRVRIERPDNVIEVTRRSRRSEATGAGSDCLTVEASPQKIDTIKADLVGIFRLSRPAPAEGDAVDVDRELGYIEALGIRTPVHGMGAGRLLSIVTGDGTPVEYGQPLFLVARGQ
jgi:2-amino-4-hydroxy-6-hydroxymethyldihydropteridine diphosphokinase